MTMRTETMDHDNLAIQAGTFELEDGSFVEGVALVDPFNGTRTIVVADGSMESAVDVAYAMVGGLTLLASPFGSNRGYDVDSVECPICTTCILPLFEQPDQGNGAELLTSDLEPCIDEDGLPAPHTLYQPHTHVRS